MCLNILPRVVEAKGENVAEIIATTKATKDDKICSTGNDSSVSNSGGGSAGNNEDVLDASIR